MGHVRIIASILDHSRHCRIRLQPVIRQRERHLLAFRQGNFDRVRETATQQRLHRCFRSSGRTGTGGPSPTQIFSFAVHPEIYRTSAANRHLQSQKTWI
jgi:hypothetical protein